MPTHCSRNCVRQNLVRYAALKHNLPACFNNNIHWREMKLPVLPLSLVCNPRANKTCEFRLFLCMKWVIQMWRKRGRKKSFGVELLSIDLLQRFIATVVTSVALPYELKKQLFFMNPRIMRNASLFFMRACTFYFKKIIQMT